MNIILSAIIVTIIVFMLIVFAAWLDGKHKRDFFEKAIDRVSSLIRSNIVLATDLQKPGPWYLVVYTKDSNYPIWISHNTIRSIHPDPKNYKLIIKQFNGEGVIENVESYELCSASDLCEYDM